MSKQTEYDKVEILGVNVDAITQTEAINYIIDHAKDQSTKSMYIVKPYVEFLDKAAKNDQLKDLLNNAELVLADGVALVWAAAWLYAGKRSAKRFIATLFQIVFTPTKLYWPLDKPLAGINFAWPMLESASANNLRIYLVGTGSTEQIKHVADTIKSQLPEINIVGAHSGRDTTEKPGQVSNDWRYRLGENIKLKKADLILVGMGFPLQEDVISKLSSQLKHGVLIGEGGTFDYEQFGGNRPKAPNWVQRIGLEWLWRLFLQPKRIFRQFAVPRFIWRVWRSR